MSEHIQEVREAMQKALDTFRPQAKTVTLKIPGPGWEEFPLSVGAPVFWRREKTTRGRLVRFRAFGPCSMGPHFHDTPEVIIADKGVINITVNGSPRTLVPGETYTAQRHELHSAQLNGVGEALAHWTDQETDQIDVSYFPP